MGKPIALCLLLTCMILSAGCTAYKLLHSTKFEEPKVTFSEYRINRVTDRQTEVDFTILVLNPNPVGIRGLSVDYELYLDENRFASGRALEIELPPERESPIKIPVVVVYKEMLNTLGPAIERLLSNQKSMPITVKAKVYGNPRLFSKMEEGVLPPFEKRITQEIDIPLPQGDINKAIRSLL